MNRKRFASRLTIVALFGLLPMATGACGFVFTHAPPQGHEQMPYFTCTEGNVGPILDAVVAGLSVVGVVVGIAATEEDLTTGTTSTRGEVIAGNLVGVAIWGSAAVVGFNKSKKCRAAKLALAQRQALGQAARGDLWAVDAVVQSVVVSPATDTLPIGEQVQLGATAYSYSGAVIFNKMFTWSSSNDAIASVSNAGLVTAHANGAVVIVANTDNVVGTDNIVVASRR